MPSISGRPRDAIAQGQIDRGERDYQSPDFFWTDQAHPVIRETVEYVRGGRALDLGMGEGRNAVFMAERGLEVTGIELAPAGIAKAKMLAAERNVAIGAIAGDMREIPFEGEYDLIVSIAALHFLPEEEAHVLIRRMQAHTKSGGINTIAVFTDQNPAKNFAHLFREEELPELYRDWEALKYVAELGPEERHGDGPLHRHGRALMIARKL